MYENIRYEVNDGIATITFDRPERLNAYTLEMGEEAYAAFGRARGDDAVRAVVFTGAGRGFCSGVDLEHLKAQHASATTRSGPALGEEAFVRTLPLEIVACPKPVIAAINGACIGVGITMALPCDIRVAAEDAKIGLTFTKLGILPGLGSTHLLPRLVGTARALELVLTGGIVRGREAARIGLVNHAVPGAEVLPRAIAIAAAMIDTDPAVLAAAKRAIHFGSSAAMADAMANEQRESAALRAQRNR